MNKLATVAEGALWSLMPAYTYLWLSSQPSNNPILRIEETLRYEAISDTIVDACAFVRLRESDPTASFPGQRRQDTEAFDW